MRPLIFFILSCFIIFSCKQKVDDDVLSKAKMASVMYDLVRADEYATNLIQADTGRNEKKHHIELYQKVFLLHNISRETFQKSYKWYTSNPAEFKVVLDTLTETLKRPAITPSTRPFSVKPL